MRALRTFTYLALFISLCSASQLLAQPQFVLKWTHDFEGCLGVGVDPSGSVFVADGNNSRIQKFDGSGNFILMWGSAGTAPGQFNGPYDIAADATGNIYVTDYSNHRVQKFDGSGNFILMWGSLGSGNGQFNCPTGIAVDQTGNIYVADGVNGRIQRFDGSGHFIAKWGLLTYPRGIAVDSSGDVYVTDAPMKIRKYDSGGHLLLEWSPVTAPVSDPFGIAVDSVGNLLVTETQDRMGPARVEMFTNTGALILSWGEGQFTDPRSIAVSGNNIYVSNRSGVIFKFLSTPVGIRPETWSIVKGLYRK